MENNPATKFCPGCTQPKAANLFGIRRASADGLSAQCRACIAERNRVKYWVDPAIRAKSKAKSIDKKRERFARDPAYKRAFRLWGRAQTKSKVPPWVKIVDFVPVCKKALRKGLRYEIDHVIPLRHPLVCGLHVPDNVRVVLRKTNAKKGNSWSLDF